MRINQNISAMNTYSRLTAANTSKSNSLAKLSSGLRINKAGDDAAGLAISEKMRGQVSGLKQAVRNAQDGISLIQTAEGALSETHSILNRMRELAVQSSNGTNTESDRKAIQEEMNQLATEITRISTDTEFNTQNLLGGDFKAKFHIGANSGQNMGLEIGNMSADALKVSGDGEGKATCEIGATVGGTAAVNAGISVGEQTLNVVKVDNVTLATAGKVANYGLANDKGEIVATSQDGKVYESLDGAYKVDDLAAAKVAGNTLTFADEVSSGDVTLTAAADGTLSDVTATASINVNDLQTGKYEVISGADAANILGISLNGTTDVAHALKGEDGNVAALSTNGLTWYALEGTGDLTAANPLAAAVTATTAKTVMTSGTALTTPGASLEIAADGGIDVSTQEAADTAIKTIDAAIESVSAERSKLGATQNRLDHTINNLTATAENLSAAESRIRDVDMAEEMMEFTKNNILSQAATSMLAQANQMPQSVLQLLQ
ncbi:MAG: flagellin [Tissierellaceae bacterium]|nr:flagellin [Tissierellaceae bacterium]